MRRIAKKSEREIAQEWTRIASFRAQQIQSRSDLSFHYVLLPSILDLSSCSDFSSVIDIGCGGGFVTEKLAERALSVVALDLSSENLAIAQQRLGHLKNVTLFNGSVEHYTQTQEPNAFSLAVTNMVLMTAVRLDKFIRSVAHLLKPGGHFVFTITHPCFWPQYWNYAHEDWFRYTEEIIIEAPFRISTQDTEGPITTHVHRPLSLYINSLRAHGLTIDQLVEPMPPQDVEQKYPAPWAYPRFLGARCLLLDTGPTAP
jgi:SAM-dependent methyltransferase